MRRSNQDIKEFKQELAERMAHKLIDKVKDQKEYKGLTNEKGEIDRGKLKNYNALLKIVIP